MKNLLQFQKLVKIPRRFSSNLSQNEKRICVVGAGPAGFYATQYIAKHLPNCRVDIIEKLPVPFGLVRFGVAPDHPEVKNVINTFTKTAGHPSVRFFGNVSLGKDLTLADLRRRYHAVILSYGAEKDRKLGIPNEDRSQVVSAREFVAWYNGLPGTEQFRPHLNGESVAIIGQGNVAVDVARILLSPVDELAKTDITEQSLAALAASTVKRVHLIGRRGPLQAAFTIKELREMTKLPDVRVIWRPEDFAGIAEQVATLARPRKRITELMLSNLAEQCKQNGSREFRPIFLRSPKVIEDGKTLQMTVNRLDGDRAVATSDSERIEADLVLRSIGYKSISMDSELNFDERHGLVCNVGGRVLTREPIDGGQFERGLYACGWLATGPTGVILTTMTNAFTVAKAVCEDFGSGAIEASERKQGLDVSELKDVVTWSGWQKIDCAEMAAGKGTKPREKIIDVTRMLDIALN